MKTFSPITAFLFAIVALLALATWLAQPGSVETLGAHSAEIATPTQPAHAWLAEAFPVAQAGFVKPAVAGG